jgi:hypothetical protein
MRVQLGPQVAFTQCSEAVNAFPVSPQLIFTLSCEWVQKCHMIMQGN